MINCTKCSTPVAPQNLNLDHLTPCHVCGRELRVSVFPAAIREKPASEKAEPILFTDDASCFYHSKKKAITHCSSCGRFLCALCDVEIDGKHICFPCMEKGKQKNELKTIENQRTLYDSAALALAIYPLLFFWITCITAPASLFIVFRHWRTPTSIVRRTKVRFVAAFILSALQVIAWSVVIWSLST